MFFKKLIAILEVSSWICFLSTPSLSIVISGNTIFPNSVASFKNT